MIHPIDYRYGSEKMRKLFDEETRLRNMLEVEAALIKSLVAMSKAPKGADKDVEKAITKVELKRVKEHEAKTKHDVMAMVLALTEQCDKETGKYVHLTATSYDIVDSAIALQLRDATKELVFKAKELLKSLYLTAFKHRSTLMIGRTHGQHAVPITFGFKLANYVEKLGEDIARLNADLDYVQGKFSGAVGTYAAQTVYGMGDDLEGKVMEQLQLKPAPISTQVVARENTARLICDIAIMAGTMEQIAKEIRNLQRTEIGEAMESFGKEQVGSSTMAQKTNPINCENVCSNCRVIRSCVQPALENIALEHERDLTNSACERSILPTAYVLMDDVLIRMKDIIDNLHVDSGRMKQNLDMTKGRVMAEALITELVKRGMPRQEAHELLRQASMKSAKDEVHLAEVLKKNKRFTRFIKEPKEFMKYDKYVGLAEKKTVEITKKWKERKL